MYTVQEKTEIERVLKAFENYIADAKNAYGHPTFEVVWLEKLKCYLYVENYNRSAKLEERHLTMLPVQSAKHLCFELVASGVIHGFYTALFGKAAVEAVDKAEYRRVYDSLTEQRLNQITEEIQQWVQPYIQALPEYAAYMQEVVQEQLKDLKKR